ncbi:MAG: hypothetical protein ACYDBY_21045 [Thermoanaerobaculia bacterium]
MSEKRGGRFLQLVLGLYFLEAGLLLVVAPWSTFWLRRVVLPSPASIEPLLVSSSFRGFVAGLGLLHLALAARVLLGRPEKPA